MPSGKNKKSKLSSSVKNIVFISDFFVEMIQGGGELVDDCLMRSLSRRGYDIIKIQSENVTQDFIARNINSFFIVSNFTRIGYEAALTLQKVNYVLLEHDHKYVANRNPSIYRDFSVPANKIVNAFLYQNAKMVLCQSKLHAEVVKKNLNISNVINLGCSLWHEEHLEVLRQNITTEKTKGACVIQSSNEIKGTAKAVSYCNEKGIEFDHIPPSQYNEFIGQLAQYKRLIFFPQVLESFNRLAIEARILNCELTTNNLLGCTSEDWFSQYKGEALLNFIEQKQDEVVDKVESLFESKEKINNTQADITVILNSYRRPYNLKSQVESIRKQTNPPKEVWLWVNAHDDNKDFNYDDLQIDKILDNNYNWKFYGRFAAALLADTEYVAIFDDDTVPGERWFENCLETMKTNEGILGSAGIILNGSRYVQHDRCGWPTQNEELTEVDLVGHAWFFKRDWLQYLWREKPTTWDNGEDIQFSYLAQKYGDIKTYCPPHPPENIELFGSIMGNELGIDAKATSNNNETTHQQFFSERDICVQTALKGGWQTVRGVEI